LKGSLGRALPRIAESHVRVSGGPLAARSARRAMNRTRHRTPPPRQSPLRCARLTIHFPVRWNSHLVFSDVGGEPLISPLPHSKLAVSELEISGHVNCILLAPSTLKSPQRATTSLHGRTLVNSNRPRNWKAKGPRGGGCFRGPAAPNTHGCPSGGVGQSGYYALFIARPRRAKPSGAVGWVLVPGEQARGNL